MKILIVDDEPLARDLIETYVRKIHDFELAGTCGNALEAFAILNKQHIDLLFLDIDMPEINGINLIKALKNPPKVVFTTAYAQFAVESYELNAIDYMLKPVTFDRFMKSVQKANELIKKEKEELVIKADAGSTDNIIFIKSEGKMIKIDLGEVWFIEGLKNYIMLWMTSGKIIVHSTMKNIEDQLMNLSSFVRINKSYIVNLKYVTEIDGNAMIVKGQALAIGNTYREDVQKIIDRYKLI